MMKRSALYQTSRLSLISCSVSSLKQQSTDRHVAPLEYEPTNIYSFTLMLRAQRGSNNYQCYRLWLYRNSCTTLRKNKLHNERKEMHLFDSNFCDLLYYIILTQVYQKIFLQVSIMVNTIQTNESVCAKIPLGHSQCDRSRFWLSYLGPLAFLPSTTFKLFGLPSQSVPDVW